MYQVGAFAVQPTQALAGQRPTVHLQADGFAPRERVHVEGGPWNPFYALADDHGSIATTQDVFTPTAGRYMVAASGNSGAVGRTTFYLTGIVPGSSQITQGSGGRFLVAGAG